jgi:hypothetical protein
MHIYIYINIIYITKTHNSNIEDLCEKKNRTQQQTHNTKTFVKHIRDEDEKKKILHDNNTTLTRVYKENGIKYSVYSRAIHY